MKAELKKRMRVNRWKGKLRFFLSGILILITALVGTGCGEEKLVVAEQFGLAYAPIEVMRAQGFLEQALEDEGLHLTVEWARMANTAAIREAMLANQLDIGFMAIPPFLIGKDNGMDWRIMSGVSESPLGLVTGDPEIQTTDDVDASHRIILPQPGSVQHILLSMYTERVYGDANKFDDQLMTLSHPDGMTAMLSGDSSYLHFTSPPYLQQELNSEGFHEILDGEACFGDAFTFIVAVCPERVYREESVYKAFMSALEASMAFMQAHPDETRALLASAYEYSEAELDAYLSDPQMQFNKTVRGVETFEAFMLRAGYLEQAPDPDTLYWEAYEQ